MALGVTVGDLAERVRDNLQGTSRGELNVLAEDLDASETDIDFSDTASGIRPGSYIECVKATGSEVMYVRTVSGTTATVLRAQAGTTATTFTSGDLIRVEQQFWTHRIKEALKEDVASWPTDVYQLVQEEISVGADASAFDLSVDSGRRVVWYGGVRRAPETGFEHWPVVEGAMLAAHQETDDFASGYAIELAALFGEAVAVRVLYGLAFDVTTFDLDTDLETIGLTQTMVDIPVLGACWRLLGPREALRVQTAAQGQSRDAEAVPPTAITRTSEWFRTMRQFRLGEESMRLVAQHPWRS